MTRPDILHKVRVILDEQLSPGCKPEEILETHEIQYKPLYADSLDAVEIVMAIEEEFGIDIPDDDYENGQIKTVGDIVNYIERNLPTYSKP